MVSSTEHSKTDEDRDAVGESPPEAVASQTDSDAELAKLEDRWRRAVADLDNLRKRYARELERVALRNNGRYVGLPTSVPLEQAVFGSLVRTGALQ